MENDQNLLNILLELEKGMVKNYSIAITEASNDELTENFCELFNSSMNISKDLFYFANSNGWYQLEYATDNKIQNELSKLTNKFGNM